MVKKQNLKKSGREEIIREAKKNIKSGEIWHKKINIREIIFGFQDNSIAVLAVIAGVIGGSLMRGQIIMAGIAAAIAGGISVAIGEFVSSKSEVDYFNSEIERERREQNTKSDVEREEVKQLYMKKAKFTDEELKNILNRITGNKRAWLDVMMKEELGLFKDRFANPWKVSFILAISEIIGGLLPTVPFVFITNIGTSFIASIILTYCILFCIGVWKTTFTKKNKILSGLGMVLAGVLATLIPYFIGKFISSLNLHF